MFSTLLISATVSCHARTRGGHGGVSLATYWSSTSLAIQPPGVSQPLGRTGRAAEQGCRRRSRANGEREWGEGLRISHIGVGVDQDELLWLEELQPVRQQRAVRGLPQVVRLDRLQLFSAADEVEVLCSAALRCFNLQEDGRRAGRARGM